MNKPRVASLLAVVIAGWLTQRHAPAIAFESQQLVSRLASLDRTPAPLSHDWLIETKDRPSGIYRGDDPRELVLDNGLIRRTFLLTPNLATVGLRNLQNGESILRSVQPECQVTLDGRRYNVGGLTGQPIGNYLPPRWYEALRNDEERFQLVDFHVQPIQARFDWKPRDAWISQSTRWPPTGQQLTFVFSAPTGSPASQPRQVLWEDQFTKLDPQWQILTSSAHARTSFQNEGKAGEIYALENTYAVAELPWREEAQGIECEIDAGTDRAASWGAGLAVVLEDGQIVKLNLRPGKNEYGVFAGGRETTWDGLDVSQSAELRILRDLAGKRYSFWVRQESTPWQSVGEYESDQRPLSIRIGKLSRDGRAADYSEPGDELKRSRVKAVRFLGAPQATTSAPLAGVQVRVHYAIYDGLPLLCKWFTLTNGTDRTITLDHFTSEILGCVEASSQVEDLAEPMLPNLHVETDFTSCSMHGASSQRDSVYWLEDPTYQTQVNYRRQTKCLLECRPPLGPAEKLVPGATFTSFRTWILAHDSRDETRQALGLCRMYGVLAPWTAENPLIHHVRSARPDAVRLAIDQSADVGFELVIMTFGSGFNLENEDPAYLQQIRELVDYAHAKGVALGGYSLLASRSIGVDDDVVNPATGRPGGFARFGNSPCLCSEWGEDYFRKLYAFYEATGCDVLEHDGSYPGDACASHEHPGHAGYEDSRWKQWRKITDFYRWCRGRGIYLNVPDWYFLNGSTKVAMGYRETNWSLPREMQEIIERQNIHDGTRFKSPTMGWMFVPLTQYHGGGAAATIEPLNEHLDHYERRLQNLLGAGVQACFRGPRLYDTPETREVVKRWVDFYKQHRAILDSPLIPLRRPDGQDWDGLLHVNPALETPAFAMLYNPLPDPIEREIQVPLYYAGLRNHAVARVAGGPPTSGKLDARQRFSLQVTIPAHSATWVEFTSTEANQDLSRR